MKTNDLTPYDRYLVKTLSKRYKLPRVTSTVEFLIELGVVDKVKCKILIIREFVHQLVKEGHGKVDAMYAAASEFGCSYEYVRSCMYYYTNVNFI